MEKTIKDIITFFAKTNYKKYLEDNKLERIEDDDIYNVVSSFYDGNKCNIKEFVINTYKTLCEKNNSEYPGDYPITNILLSILQKDEDEYVKQRIVLLIEEHQSNS